MASQLKKLTRQDIMAMLPDHLKGSTVHIVGPNDDYDEEEGSDGEIDPEFDQMNVPEHIINKRNEIEEENQAK